MRHSRSNVFFAAILFVALEIFSEDEDILTDLAHLKEQLSKVGPETALECARRAILGMPHADDACIVSRSPRGLERMMALFINVFGVFGLTILESKMKTMCMPIPHAPATQIVFNAMGQQYCQTTSFAYLGGAVTETPKLSAEIDRRIRSGWMSFRRYTPELYDRSKESLLHLKARMVKSDVVVEALPYGCATWTPLDSHCNKLCITHHGMLLPTLGVWCTSKSPNNRIPSFNDVLQRVGCEGIEATVCTRRLVWSGALLRMSNHSLPKCHVGSAGERGTT